MTRPPRRLDAALSALAAAVTAAALAPVLRNGFVNWDDGRMLVDNPHLREPAAQALRWAATTDYFCNYQPTAWLSYLFDARVWGLSAFGVHLTSLLLHAAAAAALYFCALQLMRGTEAPGRAERAGALAAALLFAVHPLRVEAVAWAADRRDVVCGLFFILSVLAHLRGRRGWSLAAGCAAMLAKPAAVVLPAVLLLLDVFPLRRLAPLPRSWLPRGGRGVLLEKAPLAAAAALAGALSLRAQNDCGALIPLKAAGAAQRLSQAAFGVLFYAGKSLWPVRLSAAYDLSWSAHAGALALGAAALAAVAAAAALRPRWRPALLAGLAFYLLALLPVLGLVKLGSAAAADRYSYLPCLAWAVLLGAAVREAARAGGLRARAGACAAAIAVLALAAAAGARCAAWRDSEALWRSALASDRMLAIGRPNLADALISEGRRGEALLYLDEQLKLYPRDEDSARARAALEGSMTPGQQDRAAIQEALSRDYAARGDAAKARWFAAHAAALRAAR